MSGYGIAGANDGLYFATGNSDGGISNLPNPTSTYDGVTNIQESVVGINADLTSQRRVYTPSNVLTLDRT